jgi:hypothetical protein
VTSPRRATGMTYELADAHVGHSSMTPQALTGGPSMNIHAESPITRTAAVKGCGHVDSV